MQMPNQIKQCKIIFESHIKTTAVKKLKEVSNSGNYNQNKMNTWFLNGIEVVKTTALQNSFFLPNFANKDEGE